MPLLLDWRTASQPDDVLRPVVAALQQGGLVALPTESGYLVAADAAIPEAIERLAAAPSADSNALVLLVSGSADIERWTGTLPPSVERMLNRLWPGPLGLIVPLKREWAGPESVGHKWTPDDRLRFRSPKHPASESALLSSACPLIAREVSADTGTTLAELWGDALSVVVDAGPIPPQPITWTMIDQTGWRIEQPGILSEADIIAAAARWIVFVCTGNTCRSPMAEALGKALLAARLGCEVGDLPRRGYRLLSAGVSAYSGDAPSPEAVDVLREFNADLSAHRSQPLALEVVAFADDLIAMTRSHLLTVLTHYPVIGGSMRLLCGMEGDLNDPIGCSREVYATCAATILRCLNRFFLELLRR